MELSQLHKPKNSQTAWVLAVVLFFSGLTFSSPSFARERQVKARIELVPSTGDRSTNAFSSKHFPPSQKPDRFIEFYV